MIDQSVMINQYKILSHIGSGSFGYVYKAQNTHNQQLVAIKKPIDNPNRDNQKWIIEEAKIYNKLSNPEFGICNVKIIQKHNTKMLVMDLLGDSLSCLLNQYRKFGIKTVILIAIEMLHIMKYIHSKGFIHRDLKPDNFTIGSQETELNKIYCIDFGLAKKIIKKNGELIPQDYNHKFMGTARYASINAHKGYSQSYKDDLESLGYLLVYFYKGKLPWQNIKCSNKEKRNKLILKQKTHLSREDLCSSLPKEFTVYFNYLDSLEYTDIPRYNSIIHMFEKLYHQRGYTNKKLEWEVDLATSTKT